MMRVLSVLFVFFVLLVAQALAVHSHRCATCGNTWTHGEENVGYVGPHTCQVCGTVTWARYYGGAVARRYLMPGRAARVERRTLRATPSQVIVVKPQVVLRPPVRVRYLPPIVIEVPPPTVIVCGPSPITYYVLPYP